MHEAGQSGNEAFDRHAKSRTFRPTWENLFDRALRIIDHREQGRQTKNSFFELINLNLVSFRRRRRRR